MRPPEFTGGNDIHQDLQWMSPGRKNLCFNEAAGIHRRKPVMVRDGVMLALELLQ